MLDLGQLQEENVLLLYSLRDVQLVDSSNRVGPTVVLF
jgi:hypothetical protein